MSSLVAITLFGTGCPNETEGVAGGTDGFSCDTDGSTPAAGAWDPVPEDWSDVGEPGFTGDQLNSMCGAGNVVAHHCFLTAVHATHLHTGEILMYHGEHDERVWEIGAPPEEMTWHPVGPETTWQEVADGASGCESTEEVNGIPVPVPGCWDDVTAFPDVFCSGQVSLPDGRVLTAGGNITGRSTGGGLADMFLFNPVTASPAFNAGCGFGWEIEPGPSNEPTNPLPKMAIDRWYPTLTALGDGRVLIAGGTSRAYADDDGDAQQPPLLEVFNPTASTIGDTGPGEIDALISAEFPVGGMPNYPFMFLLPNGDVFYAGAEGATTQDLATGRILVPETNSDTEKWKWHDHVVASNLSGGSAVMWEPGKILKTGGPQIGSVGNAERAAEWVDLSAQPPNDYSGAPTSFAKLSNSTDPQTPNFARHYHNLVLLPDGRVVAVGGNTGGNGSDGEHFVTVYGSALRGDQRGLRLIGREQLLEEVEDATALRAA